MNARYLIAVVVLVTTYVVSAVPPESIRAMRNSMALMFSTSES